MDPAPPPGANLFLGRQPILDREQKLVAFELLFRASHANQAQVIDDTLATSTVIRRAFTELGIESVLGPYRGFINLNAELLMGDLIEILPKGKVVLELLETVEITPEVVARCRDLKAMGYSLALDDFFHVREEFHSLLEIVDVVKVDLLTLDPAGLAGTVAQLKRWPVKLLAEKVDSRGQAQRCLALGFDLFQGYYFAKPTLITGKHLSHSERVLMGLMGLVLSDAGPKEIEAAVNEAPGLAHNLLRLANSAAAGLPQRPTSLRQAITLLDRARRRRWLQLLMFSVADAGASGHNPLLQLAAFRGKLMEQLATAGQSADPALQDRAFMVGTLSLMEALLSMPLAEILAPLPLAQEVRDALLGRSGRLGSLLNLAEAVEHDAGPGITAALAALPGLTIDQVGRAETEALVWANSLAEPLRES